MASNTSLLIKRSSANSTPGVLQAGEFAYSYLSNTLFLGTVAGDGVLNVGGVFYTSQIDSATDANTPLGLVRRDASGNASFNYVFGTFVGNANTATYLQNPQNFSISGGDMYAAKVLFGGNNSVTLAASLNAVPGLSNSTVGSTTAIPVIQYGANGRILGVSTAALYTQFNVFDGANTISIANGNTWEIDGIGGITTQVSGSRLVIGTNTSIMRTNTALVGTQVIGTDVAITGNLTVTGSTSYVNTTIYETTSSLIELAANNTVGDVVDIGFYGIYNNGTQNNLTGLVRDAGSKDYYLFNNIQVNGSIASNVINANEFTGQNTATLHANLVAFQVRANTANITNATIGSLQLLNQLTVPNGGTGNISFASGQIIIGNGTGALQPLANAGTAATYGLANTVPVFTTDAWGRISAVNNTAISIDASQVTSGQLAISQGGTNNGSFINNELVFYNGSGIVSLANTNTAGTYGNNSYLPVITTDNFGRVISVANTLIKIDANNLNQSTTGSGAVVLNNSPTIQGTATFAKINVQTLLANTPAFTAAGAMAQFTGNSNSYQQVIVQNSNNGSQASADFVVSNDLGADNGFYGDFGMNSSQFTGTGSLNKANAVYMYASNSDLVFGTALANSIHFVVNNGATDAMTIYGNNFVALSQALTVPYGGTGQSYFTPNGLVYGNGSQGLQITQAAGVSDQTYSNQLMTVTNAGTPVWTSTLDGGRF